MLEVAETAREIEQLRATRANGATVERRGVRKETLVRGVHDVGERAAELKAVRFCDELMPAPREPRRRQTRDDQLRIRRPSRGAKRPPLLPPVEGSTHASQNRSHAGTVGLSFSAATQDSRRPS